MNKEEKNEVEKVKEKAKELEEEKDDKSSLLSSSKKAQFALLATTTGISICGISYELLIATISSYFLGNAVLQYSLTIGIFLFAMGIGSYLSRKFDKKLVESFIAVQMAIGLLGGFSIFALFTAYKYSDYFSLIMYAILLVIGALAGLEVPLLIRIMKDYEALKFSISDILSFDYVGALAASIFFPLFVLPHLGMMHASFFYGLLNMVIIFLNLSIFGEYIKQAKRYFWTAVVVTVILGAGLFFSNTFVMFFESRLFTDEIILTKQTKYQRIVMTRYKDDVRLFLDGNLQFSSWDEYRYHECLVHPAMSLSSNREQVLILGGGDGLAAREVLKYPEVKRITLVDIDRDMVELCKNDRIISRLNEGSLKNPKMNIVIEDAFSYIEKSKERFGVIIIDLPDPNNESLSKLYTRSFYSNLKNHLAKGGMICLQATSPYFAREVFWCIFHTVKATGSKKHPEIVRPLNVIPFHVFVSSMGDWGFILASNVKIDPNLININVPTKFLKKGNVNALFYFGKDSSEVETEINTLNSHKVLEYYEKAWEAWE